MAPQVAVRVRWAVFFTAILISLFASYLAYTSITALTLTEENAATISNAIQSRASDDELELIIDGFTGPGILWLIVRSIGSSIVALASLAYAASWLRQFYHSETESAREIDRFNYDLNRASWIIETILEVQYEKKGDVPEAWIQGVTRGLFDGPDDRKAVNDSVQALQALLGFAASASFGPEGPKFEINRRNARRLAREDDV